MDSFDESKDEQEFRVTREYRLSIQKKLFCWLMEVQKTIEEQVLPKIDYQICQHASIVDSC